MAGHDERGDGFSLTVAGNYQRQPKDLNLPLSGA
jgi:hypothetical protein